MEVKSYEENETLIIEVSGKLDTLNAPQFAQALEELLKQEKKSYLLDLSKVTFLSSSGLQVLLAGAKTTLKQNIPYRVFGMSEMVHDVFFLSGFNHFIDSFQTKEEALA